MAEIGPALTCGNCRQCKAPSDAATLIAAYHASSRAELIARLDRRDSSMFLYLAAVAALLSVFLASYPRGALSLLVIPLLGLGGAQIHSQHNTVIGALGVYIGAELHQAAAKETDVGDVRSWDASDTLRLLRGHIGTRVGSSLVIFVAPSIIAIVLVSRAMEPEPVTIGLLVLAGLAAAWTTSSLIRAHRRRSDFRAQLERSLSKSS